MGLDNLVGISLDKINPDASVIKRLISAAERNIKDARVVECSQKLVEGKQAGIKHER